MPVHSALVGVLEVSKHVLPQAHQHHGTYQITMQRRGRWVGGGGGSSVGLKAEIEFDPTTEVARNAYTGCAYEYEMVLFSDPRAHKSFQILVHITYITYLL